MPGLHPKKQGWLVSQSGQSCLIFIGKARLAETRSLVARQERSQARQLAMLPLPG